MRLKELPAQLARSWPGTQPTSDTAPCSLLYTRLLATSVRWFCQRWSGALDSVSKCLTADLLNILFEFGLAEPLGICGRQKLEAIFKVMDPRPREALHVAHHHTADE